MMMVNLDLLPQLIEENARVEMFGRVVFSAACIRPCASLWRWSLASPDHVWSIEEVGDLLDRSASIAACMAPSDTQFENLKKRVKDLEDKKGDQATSQPASWNQKNPLLTWLISLTVPTVAIIITVYAGVIPHIEKHVDDQIIIKVNDGLKQPLENIGKTSNDIAEIKGTLKAWTPFIQEIIKHQFENVSKLPAGALIPRIPALENLVAVARNQNVTVDPNIVTQVGTKLVDASRQNANAWNAALRFLEYKSFNNSFSSLLPDTTNVAVFRDKYVINIPSGGVAPKSSLKGSVPADVAAQTGYIGEDRNKGMTSGPAWIVMEGGEVGLDGIQLRNVIFRNVRINYWGGPLIMKNVYFVDCTFNMHVDSKTQQFAIALLAPTPSTSFQSTPRS